MSTVPKLSLAPLGVLAAVVLSLSACQPASYQAPAANPEAAEDRAPLSDIAWLDSPQEWVGPSTALLTEVAIDPITDEPEANLPTTVTSDDLSGPRDVTVSRAERVLALDMSGSLAATVWALGLGDPRRWW